MPQGKLKKDGEKRRREKTEGQNGKKEIAKKLLEMGMTIEQIIDATQLSKEEIEKLSEKKQNYMFINLAGQR